jgi:hypothetical protein
MQCCVRPAPACPLGRARAIGIVIIVGRGAGSASAIRSLNAGQAVFRVVDEPARQGVGGQERVARTCPLGPRHFVVISGRTADLQNRSALLADGRTHPQPAGQGCAVR